MFIEDNTSKCTIFNSTFFDNLQNYQLNEISSDDGGLLEIQFGEDKYPVTFNWEAFETIANSNKFNWTYETGPWSPIFVANPKSPIAGFSLPSANYTKSKEIRRNASIKKINLGIENFIQFQGKFKDWTIDNDTKLNVNWFINSNDISYVMDYGLLCWYKKSDNIRATTWPQDTIGYSLDSIPIGSKVICDRDLTAVLKEDQYGNITDSVQISRNEILVKHGKTKLIKVDKDDSIFNSTSDANNRSASISFNTERKIFDLKKVRNLENNQPKFLPYGDYLHSGQEFALIKNGVSLWIPNGEAYSYSYNNNRASENLSFQLPGPSYLSPSLFYIYNAIYHRLTFNMIRKSDRNELSTNDRIDLNKSGMLKKLCYFLSTSPMIDRTTVDFLYDEYIQNTVNNMLNTPLGIPREEIKIISSTLQKIMQRLEGMAYKYPYIFTNLATNIINNKKELFKKICNKYIPHLLIKNNTQISYNHLIDHGPNITVRRGIRSLCPDKNLKNEVGQDSWQNIIYNNEIIQCQGLKLETNFSPNSSEIILSDDKILPTADIIRSPLGGERNTDLGPDIIVKLKDDNTQTSFTLDIEGEPGGIVRDTSFYELIEGPDCLRFSDCKTDPDIFGRCAYTARSRVSRDGSPVVYVRSRGLYIVKVTAISLFDIQTDIIRIYVVDNNGEYGPGLYPPPTARPAQISQDRVGGGGVANYKNTAEYASNLSTSDYLKCMCMNMTQFAMSKTHSIFWPLSTDSYVIQSNMTSVLGSTVDFNVGGMVKLEKFSYSGVKILSSENEKTLTFTIKPETSHVIWDSVIIEHMRSEHPDCAQCGSFFIDTLIKQPQRSKTSVAAGLSGFVRSKRAPDGVSLNRYDASSETSANEPIVKLDGVDIPFLPVSMRYAPALKAYGGYSSEVLKNLGITGIPGHPPVGSTLPVLKQRHFFGFPKETYCYLRPIHISNTADIPFNKGVFHPKKGWISYDSPLYSSYRNKDASYKFNTQKLKTFRFKGLGFYNIKSSVDRRLGGPGQTLHYINPIPMESSIYLGPIQEINNSYNESDDHNYNYGYRDTNTFYAKESDEYASEIRNGTQEFDYTGFACGINGIAYGINRSDLDDLYIENIEIKINNLNYPNPKHLCIWLEVTSSVEIPALPQNQNIETNFSNYVSEPSLLSYMTSLQNMNTSSNPFKRQIYLLNRESIDNYEYNFNITFSDRAGYNTVYDNNKNNLDILSNSLEDIFSDNLLTIKNNSVVPPTLMANGYSDSSSIKFKEAILRNKLYDPNNSLSKFKGIPLKGATFTLKMAVYDENDTLIIKDMTTLNNTLLGVSSTVKKSLPNILSNAICSWDLIIHTNKLEQPIPSDPIGSIDRTSSAPSFNRCNFIADFKNKKYLIPQANLNAPYQYISNVNTCSYKEQEFSTVTRFNTIDFPTWAIVQIIAAMTPIYFGGGFVFTGDPSSGYDAIYDWFSDQRGSNRTDIQVRKTHTGRYTEYGFGNPDKVLLNVSQDGNSWYKLEAPIYKYSNSYILRDTNYQYIKLSKNIFPMFSRLPFNLLKEKDLDSIYSFSGINFWRKHNISSLTTLPNINNLNHFIKIKDTRAYYLFDKNESIFINRPTSKNPDAGFDVPIKAKGIVNINNENYTIFYFEDELCSDNNESKDDDCQETYIAKTNNDTLLVFRNDYSTVGENIPFNKWGLEKPPVAPKTPDRHFNTLGEGSYGRGTEVLRESSYTYLIDDNTIDPIYKILNHKVSPKLNFNKVTINGATIEPVPNTTPKEALRGYPWSLNENQKKLVMNYILSNKEPSRWLRDKLESMVYRKRLKKETYEEQIRTQQEISPSLEEILEAFVAIDNEITEDQINQMFLADLRAYLANLEESSFLGRTLPETILLKNKVIKLIEKTEKELAYFYNSQGSYTFMDLRCSQFSGVANYGTISIENDWTMSEPRNRFSDNEITTMQNRIDFLKTKTTTFERQVNQAKAATGDDPMQLFPYNIPIETLKGISIPDLLFYLSSIDSKNNDKPYCYTKNGYSDNLCRQSFTKRLISDREDEMNELTVAIETNINYEAGILPVVQRSVKTNSSGGLYIEEQRNDDYYWIVLDPEQYCSVSLSATPKVLVEAEYGCVAAKGNTIGVGQLTSETGQVCDSETPFDIDGPDVKAKLNIGDTTITNLKKDQEKTAFYPNVSTWTKYTYSSSRIEQADKWIWINGGTLSNSYPLFDTLVGIKEEFEIAADNLFAKFKLKDVIDLNNQDTIKIRFGNIPRKVKEYDRFYKRYVPNFLGDLGKGLPSQGIGGRPWPTYDCWACFNREGRYIDLPDQYKVMNEMLFRAYFGSVDGIEHKNSIMSDTKQPWEWIPYEYDKEADRDYEV